MHGILDKSGTLTVAQTEKEIHYLYFQNNYFLQRQRTHPATFILV